MKFILSILVIISLFGQGILKQVKKQVDPLDKFKQKIGQIGHDNYKELNKDFQMILFYTKKTLTTQVMSVLQDLQKKSDDDHYNPMRIHYKGFDIEENQHLFDELKLKHPAEQLQLVYIFARGQMVQFRGDYNHKDIEHFGSDGYMDVIMDFNEKKGDIKKILRQFEDLEHVLEKENVLSDIDELKSHLKDSVVMDKVENLKKDRKQKRKDKHRKLMLKSMGEKEYNQMFNTPHHGHKNSGSEGDDFDLPDMFSDEDFDFDFDMPDMPRGPHSKDELPGLKHPGNYRHGEEGGDMDGMDERHKAEMDRMRNMGRGPRGGDHEGGDDDKDFDFKKMEDDFEKQRKEMLDKMED